MMLTVQMLNSMLLTMPGRGQVQLFIDDAGLVMARDETNNVFGPVLVTALPGGVDFLELPVISAANVDAPAANYVRIFIDSDGTAKAKLHSGDVVASLRGPQGVQGERGERGLRGDDGIQGVAGLEGPRGPRGYASNLTVGTVEASLPGSDPVVTITGAAPNYTVNFTLPRGDEGPQGEPGAGGSGVTAPVKVAEWAAWDSVNEKVSDNLPASTGVHQIFSEFMVLECISADLGYSVGARVRLNSGVCDDGSPLWIHQKGSAGQDHIYTTGAGVPSIEDWNNGGYAGIAPAKWKVQVWAVW